MRSAAVAAHKKLTDERNRMSRMMTELGKGRHGSHNQLEAREYRHVGNQNDAREYNSVHTNAQHFSSPQHDVRYGSDAIPPHTTGSFQGRGEIHYQSQSLAEQTLSRYGNEDRRNNDQYNCSMPTRKGADGLEYPYNPADPNYLSKYQLGFKGCFKCGSVDHFERQRCPLGNSNDRILVESFMTELAIHKPRFRAQRDEYLRRGMSNKIPNNQVSNHNMVSYVHQYT